MAAARLRRLTSDGPGAGDPRAMQMTRDFSSCARSRIGELLFREKQRLRRRPFSNELQCHVVASISLAPPRLQQPLRATHVSASSSKPWLAAEERRSGAQEKTSSEPRRAGRITRGRRRSAEELGLTLTDAARNGRRRVGRSCAENRGKPATAVNSATACPNGRALPGRGRTSLI